ncbi:dolichol-phosphate mannosyltransferase [Litorimonas taeanensis]|uniref:Dolichol-phosphate mannosyltransferase n=1 Tax=Litorimonas taeanensis TaxID=568099 RepID=A0A420WCZ8_9PROT|nr:glycosyltransferase family 2 protein [Litorimonas taeanensis]RKQ68887.1 dolichol-phosphate mannosyltransferase [Litorimonas taeanensis]
MSITPKNSKMNAEPRLSVVVPVYNEAENVAQLVEEIAKALFATSYEMIFVNDASTDDTANVLRDLKSQYSELRVLSHRANAGQSRALRTGVLAARSELIATLDGDGQNNPADIPKLRDQILRVDAPKDLMLVGGRRVKRQDSQAKLWASKWANGIRKKLLKDEADDTGCGLKLFKREAFLRLPYFDHIHRYIPALMLREGYKIEFADVSHRARIAGESKYTNFGRLMVSFSDLRGVMWLNSRSRNPKGWDEI